MRYYELWCDLDEDCAILDGPELPAALDNWLGPHSWDIPVPDDLKVHIEKAGDLLAYYDNPIPIIRKDILEAIRRSGVDNIDDYNVLVVNPETGQENNDYRAIKVIGALSAIDEEKSEGISLDDEGQAGIFYDSLIIDESKTHDALAFRLAENLGYFVVAESVMEAILESDDPYGIEFNPLFEEDGDDDEIDPDLVGENTAGFDVEGDIDHS